MYSLSKKSLSLFGQSETVNEKRWILFTDGASRGNPGASAIGIVLKYSNGKIILKEGKSIGIHTNNYAEYSALLYGIECAKNAGAKLIEVRSDSQLLVNQMKGIYKIKDKTIKGFLCKISNASEGLNIFYTHIPREKNVLADSLANKALDDESRNQDNQPNKCS